MAEGLEGQSRMPEPQEASSAGSLEEDLPAGEEALPSDSGEAQAPAPAPMPASVPEGGVSGKPPQARPEDPFIVGLRRLKFEIARYVASHPLPDDSDIWQWMRAWTAKAQIAVQFWLQDLLSGL